jgi:Lrp/AsnC family transcriptional regulator, leucine-responsive regulatory protein
MGEARNDTNRGLLSSDVGGKVRAMSKPAVTLDSFDTRILAEVQVDGRISIAELSRRVHLSQPAVSDRLKKLESSGVITGYRATVNLAALGYGIRALIRAGRTDYSRMLQVLGELPEVINAWNVTGEDSWVFEIAVADVAHLDAVVSRVCELTETSTSIILKTLREHQPMPPCVRPTLLQEEAGPGA